MMRFVIALLLCLITLQLRKKATVTLVTALWPPSAQQHQGLLSYEQALANFDVLLETDENMIIFGDEELMNRVNQKRSSSNTVFVLKSLSQLKELPSSRMVNEFLKDLKLNNPNPYQNYSHLPRFYSSQQASLLYSRMSLLKEALLYDSFSSSYIYWVDPDINNSPEYNKPQCFNREHSILRKFSQQFQLPFIVRTANLSAAHLAFDQLQKHPEVKTVAVLDWFGGRVEAIATVANAYQNILGSSLHQGEYLSQEALFSLMGQRCPKLVTEINSIIPTGVYRFDITNFIPRRIQEARHMRLLDAGASLKFLEELPATPAVIRPTLRYSQTFYEYQLLVSRVQFRLYRSETFLCVLVLCWASARVSWFVYV